MHDNARRRGTEFDRAPGCATEQLVGKRQLGGENYRVAGDPVTGIGAHRRHPRSRVLQAGHRGPVPEHDAGVGRRGGQTLGHRAHAPTRKGHPGDGVHVGDHRVGGQRLLRRHTGVERLEGEDPLQPFVADETADHLLPAAEAADTGQPGKLRGEQRQRRGEVGRDETVHLQPVQLGQPVPQPQISGSLIGTGELLDGGRHRGGIGVHVKGAAVGERGAVGRIGRHQFDVVTHRRADSIEGVLDDVGHREHGRAGVDLVAADIGLAHPAARVSVTLHHGHRASASGELQGGRETR